MEALAGIRAERGLEVGCAEGHLTRRLAAHVGELVACDMVDEALRRARNTCAELRNICFLEIDVRRDWPPGTFDLIVCSDVLYYFSKREVREIVRQSARHVRPDGFLLFANEWHSRYRWQTPPTYVVEQFRGADAWEPVGVRKHDSIEKDRSLTIALFRRV